MFPDIHLWCDTFTGVYGQHSSQSLSPHMCFSRGRMPDLNHRPPAWQSLGLSNPARRIIFNCHNLFIVAAIGLCSTIWLSSVQYVLMHRKNWCPILALNPSSFTHSGQISLSLDHWVINICPLWHQLSFEESIACPYTSDQANNRSMNPQNWAPNVTMGSNAQKNSLLQPSQRIKPWSLTIWVSITTTRPPRHCCIPLQGKNVCSHTFRTHF